MNQAILGIATAVREAAEGYNKSRAYTYAFNRRLQGACADCSYVLDRLLRQEKVDSCFVMGEYNGAGHCWVEVPVDQIIDITATQFNARYPKVYTPEPGVNEAYYEKHRGAKAIEVLDWYWGGPYRPAARAIEEMALKWLRENADSFRQNSLDPVSLEVF